MMIDKANPDWQPRYLNVVIDIDGKVDKKDRPWPLTAGHPLRAIRNFLQTTVTSLILGGHGFVLIWVALYFIAFQWIHPVKLWWDTALSGHFHLLSQHNWNTWRHLFRNGGEYYLGTAGVMLFLYNPYKRKVRKLHSPLQAAGYMGGAILLAIPLFIGFDLLINGVQHWLHTGNLAPTVSEHPSLATKLYADGWTAKLVAVLSSFIGIKWVGLPAYDYILRYFAERKVARGKQTHWYHAPAYRALVHEHYGSWAQVKHVPKEQVAQTAKKYSGGRTQGASWGNRAMVALLPVAVALIAYGTYILNHYK